MDLLAFRIPRKMTFVLIEITQSSPVLPKMLFVWGFGNEPFPQCIGHSDVDLVDPTMLLDNRLMFVRVDPDTNGR
jgi:hypothetical protein